MTSTDRVHVGTVADLRESATRLTGLSDFGADDYSDGLATILESYARDADLTPLGSKVARVGLRGALGARLMAEAAWSAHPEYARRSRRAARSSSPDCRAAARPHCTGCSPPTRLTRAWNSGWPRCRSRARRARPGRPTRCSRRSRPVTSGITSSIPSSWACTTSPPTRSRSAGSCCARPCDRCRMSASRYLPTYSAWLMGQDWTGPFRRHKRNLQMIGLNEPGKRWVLKNPSHLFSLDAIMAVYPDALVIQTHRAPRTVIGSMCSLAAHATEGQSNVFRGPVIGASQLELWARGLESFTAARATVRSGAVPRRRLRGVHRGPGRHGGVGLRALRSALQRGGGVRRRGAALGRGRDRTRVRRTATRWPTSGSRASRWTTGSPDSSAAERVCGRPHRGCGLATAIAIARSHP